ncbi:hypothetical protein ABZ814_06770 [Micromonospora musae]|uniref:hypothetical protein n=1 Tax=Micromonospora musae TaxID=1894970 RepID=UPI0033CF900A
MADGPGWGEGERLLAEVHRMLLRLAGRVPDEVLPALRELLGNGDLRYLPDAVSVATVQYAVPITPADKELLARILIVLDTPGGEPQLYDEVPVAAQPPPARPFRFLPVPPAVAVRAADRISSRLDLTGGGDPFDLTDLPADLAPLADLASELTDQLDDRALDNLSLADGVRGIWRSWRLGASDTARRVYLVELGSGVPAWEVTQEAQDALSMKGEQAPQVEAFWTGEPLTDYHRAALAGAALLWTPEAGRVRVALGAEQLTDLIRSGAPRVPVPERRMLAERLAAGAAVPGRAERLPDLIEPGRGEVVPGGYRTDGRWVWPEALGYYLTEYGVAPPRELTEALAAGGAPTPASQVAVFRAGLALSGR